MSESTKKNITWLWIAALFVATVGVSGQQIYCYCMGKTSFTLFSGDRACSDQSAAVTKSCCAKEKATPVKDCCGKKHDSKGCTKKTTRVFLLKTEFTLQEKLSEKFPLPLLDQPVTNLAARETSYPLILKNIKPPVFAWPPPPDGRSICLANGVFLC